MALWTRQAGAATVVFGPGDVSHAHADDEQVNIEQVADVSRVLVATAMRLLV